MTEENMVSYKFRLTAEDKKRLLLISNFIDVPLSELIREMLKEFLRTSGDLETRAEMYNLLNETKKDYNTNKIALYLNKLIDWIERN